MTDILFRAAVNGESVLCAAKLNARGDVLAVRAVHTREIDDAIGTINLLLRSGLPWDAFLAASRQSKGAIAAVVDAAEARRSEIGAALKTYPQATSC